MTTTVASQVLLVNHFNAIKLPTFVREYEKVGADCAREGGWIIHAIYCGCANWNLSTVRYDWLVHYLFESVDDGSGICDEMALD